MMDSSLQTIDWSNCCDLNDSQQTIDWAGVLHTVSAATWFLSLEKAVTKGGSAWFPVILGGLGHLAAYEIKKNQNVQGTAMPQS
ncbi:hypothetical protein [Alicyclobacillus sp. SO9]|uniref:hypothetical protein n=1 Tax=Alicyclobacillus sp. SO9 TaxID=2665646 RepID=UPI0018E7984B|nr:hypothetical protein [Alicyclobacillus sp. SO9]QQE79518.1 hypothetical protein GI364_03215 [Alicyclobacillus sp. SO9]